MPVVVVTGMRQTGKSTFLLNEPGLAKRRSVNLDDFAVLEAAASDPDGFVSREGELTIDEAQRRPELLAAIKRRVDRDRRPGMFLLSGSASLGLLEGVSESLAGRAVHFGLHPFTLQETEGRGGEKPALLRLWEEGGISGEAEVRPIGDEDVLAGGLPTVRLGQVRDPRVWFQGFEQTYLERDVRNFARVGDLSEFRRFLRLCALRSGKILNVSDLARDAQVPHATARKYIGILEASFVVCTVPPFLGSRVSRLVKSPKLFFADSGLCAHLCGIRELADEPMKGALLETFVAQHLAAILDGAWPGGRLHYWSVQGRREVDFVVETGRETMAIEVKAAARWGREDLKGLEAFQAVTPGCRLAVLAHNGTEAARLGERLWAVPIRWLLG
jgi:predicted AAA+ superfamily ATPase